MDEMKTRYVKLAAAVVRQALIDSHPGSETPKKKASRKKNFEDAIVFFQTTPIPAISSTEWPELDGEE